MKGKIIDIKLMQEYVEYNSTTGALTYKISGKQATSVNKHGYVQLNIKHSRYQAHRVAWALHYQESPQRDIDHINGDKTDNRISNLRLATPSQNHANIRASGIQKHRTKWRAKITIAGKQTIIGSSECPLIAHIMYIDERRKLYGEYAYS